MGNFARAMIEVSAEAPLKEEIRIATPHVVGRGYTKELVRV